jgi:hypothetical protein
MSRRRRLTVELPAPLPAALELVAELLREPDIARELAGRYRCAEGGVAVWTARHRNWVAHGEEWVIEMDTLAAKGEREIRRSAVSPHDAADPAEQARRVRLAMGRLVDKAARDRDARLQTRVFVVLSRTDAPGVGLSVTRKGGGALVALPWDAAGLLVEVDVETAFPGLADAVAAAGVDPNAPASANARLAARLNGWSDEQIAHTLAFARQRGWSAVRLSLDPAPPGIERRPASLIDAEDGVVLELNLVIAPFDVVGRALEELSLG